MNVSLALRILLLSVVAVEPGVRAVAQDTSLPEPFFPVAVWCGGGKARAPMLE